MTEVDRYRVYVYSAPHYAWDVRIDLYRGGDPRATLLFMKAGRALPPNSSANGVALLHFPMTHYAPVVDLLRNEQPLFVSLNADNGIGVISTADEPVGEEEARS
jgi:hypothetical protein